MPKPSVTQTRPVASGVAAMSLALDVQVGDAVPRGARVKSVIARSPRGMRNIAPEPIRKGIRMTSAKVANLRARCMAPVPQRGWKRQPQELHTCHPIPERKAPGGAYHPIDPALRGAGRIPDRAAQPRGRALPRLADIAGCRCPDRRERGIAA